MDFLHAVLSKLEQLGDDFNPESVLKIFDEVIKNKVIVDLINIQMFGFFTSIVA